MKGSKKLAFMLMLAVLASVLPIGIAIGSSEGGASVTASAATTTSPTAIFISGGNFTLNPGSTRALTFTVAPADASRVVSWGTSNASIASVSANGVVTAHRTGTATIWVISGANNSIVNSVTVTVTSAVWQGNRWWDGFQWRYGDAHRWWDGFQWRYSNDWWWNQSTPARTIHGGGGGTGTPPATTTPPPGNVSPPGNVPPPGGMGMGGALPGAGSTLRFTMGSIFMRGEGVMVALEAAPFIDIQTDRTMVPLRAIAEGLGAGVEWNEVTRTAHINRGAVTISLPVDQPLPGGMGVPMIVDGRTFVPLRYVSEVLGETVRWDPANRAVYVN
ncbi:MAG: stalk domain-containing protein [Defluviitaleaceae bacterium]|nr:stalk domain-containing protein [Defluviitaleaceae bacterium]